MRVRASLTHPVLPAAAAQVPYPPAHLVVTVTGDDSAGELRPRLAFVPVVDRSGSMGVADKLSLVRAALSHLAGELTGDDQLALVSFDHQVLRDLGPQVADRDGVGAFRRALSGLVPGGSTALYEGIRAGLATAAAMDPEVFVRVLVLTDGQANQGPTDPGAFAALVSDLAPNLSVSTIGVGADCDHALLARIAEAGRGSYGFVESPADAPSVVGADLGGLLSAVASDLVVTVRSRAYGTLTPLAADATALSAATEPREGGKPPLGPGWEIRLGSLLAGAERHVVFALDPRLPKRAQVRAVTVADVSVTAVVDDVRVSFEALPKVRFAAEDPDGFAPDEDLVAVVDRARLADAQRQAERLAAAGRIHEASGLLRDLDLVSPSYASMRDAIAAAYNDQGAFAASAPLRASAYAALGTTVSLTGSSVAFDSLAARTIGSYVTDAQRDWAATTRSAINGFGSLGASNDLAGELRLTNGPGSWSATVAPTASLSAPVSSLTFPPGFSDDGPAAGEVSGGGADPGSESTTVDGDAADDDAKGGEGR